VKKAIRQVLEFLMHLSDSGGLPILVFVLMEWWLAY
jgi:hypothetical protein